MASPALSKQRSQLSLVDDLAFDEMNLVEIPFALLTDGGRSSTTRSVSLSVDGDERLETAREGELPTALAERVVLALLWLTMKHNGFRSAVVRFPLRRLVQDYMYPASEGRRKGRANGLFLRRVEEELNRVADTRIKSKRWYDRELRRRTEINAAIIDYVQVVDPGGRNRARTLEVRWGAKVFKSIQDRYTKALDVRKVLSIEKPLDLRFYRWLDRQLANKAREEVASCQRFARYKMLMRGQKIERGGRTASGYIVRKLRDALGRLDGLGFSVKMVVDKTGHDYRMTFLKIEQPNHAFETIDSAAELVHEFQVAAHGRKRDAPRRRSISTTDRKLAQRWVDEFGLEKAKWLVIQCVRLHEKSRATKDTPLFKFRALDLYVDKALADYERGSAANTDAFAPVSEDVLQKAWEAYRESRAETAKEELDDETLAHWEDEIRTEVQAQFEGLRFQPSASVVEAMVDEALSQKLLQETGGLTESDFRAEYVRGVR